MKCICEMCACGKHRCRHVLPQIRPSVVTSKEPCKVVTGDGCKGEYQEGNSVKPIVLNRKTEDCIRAEGSVDLHTTHQRTLPAHQIEKSPRKPKPAVIYEKNLELMSDETEYGQNYLNETGEVSVPPSYLKKKTQPYGGRDGPLTTSVTRQDFGAKRILDRPKLQKLKDNCVVSDAPFEKKSVHQTDYTKFNEPPSKTGRRADNITTQGQPRYFETTTGSHFKQYDYQPEFHKRRTDVYVPNAMPFSGNPVMRSDYGVHKDLDKSYPVKHSNYLFATHEPMHNKTTSLTAFPNWGVQKSTRSLKEVVVYRPPSKDMELQKTSDDYKNFGQTRLTKTARPKTNIQCGGDFDGVSMNKIEFVKHDVNQRQKPVVSRAHTYYLIR